MLRIRQPIIKTDVVQTTVQDTAGYVALYRNFNVGTQTQQPQVFAQVNRVNYLGKDLSFLWTASSGRDSVGDLFSSADSVRTANQFLIGTDRGVALVANIANESVVKQFAKDNAIAYTNNPTTIRVPGSNFTIGAVFRVKDTGGSITGVVNVTNLGSWSHAINFSQGARVSIDFVASGAVATNLLSDNIYPVGTWLSVVVVFKSGDTHFYINGVKQTQVSTATLATTGLDRVQITCTKTDVLTCFTSRAVWDENDVKSWTANPWQLFRTTQPHYAVAPAVDESKKLWGVVRSSRVQNTQPRAQPQINWASPFSQDLQAAYVPNNTNTSIGQREIVRGSTDNSNPAYRPARLIPTTVGLAYSTEGGGVPTLQWSLTGTPTGATPLTLFCLYEHLDNNTTGTIWRGGSGGTYGASFWKNTDGTVSGGPDTNNGGGFVSSPLEIGKVYALCITNNRATNFREFFIDGVSLGSSSDFRNSIAGLNYFGSDYRQGTNRRFRVYCAMMWSRMLTNSEIQSLSKNPWQLFGQTHQTWYTAGILDTTPLENIGVHYNKVKTQQNKTYNSDTLRIDYANPLNDGVRALVMPGYQQKYNALWLFDNNTFQIRGAANTNTWLNMSLVYDPVYGRGVAGGGTGFENVNLNRSFTNTRGATVVMIIKPTGSIVADLFYWGTTFQSGWNGGLRGYIHADGVVNRLRLTSWNNNTTPTTRSIDADLPANQTSVVVFTYSKVNGHKIYINGQVAASDSLTGFGDLTFIDKRVGIGNRFVELYFSGLWDREWTGYEVQQFYQNPYQVFNQTQKQYYYYTKPDPVSGSVARLPRPTTQYKSQPLNITTVDRSNLFGRNTTFLWSAANPRHDATGNFLATGIFSTAYIASSTITSDVVGTTPSPEGTMYTSGTGIVFASASVPSSSTSLLKTPNSGYTIAILGRYVSTAQNLRVFGFSSNTESTSGYLGLNVNGNTYFRTANSYTQTPNNVSTSTTPYTLNKAHLTVVVANTNGVNIYVDGNLVATTTNNHLDGINVGRLAITNTSLRPIMISVINKDLNQDEVKLFGQNPWQLYKQTQQHLFYSPKPEPQPYVLRIPHTKQLAQPQAQATSNIDWGNPLSRGLLGSFTPLAQYNASNQPATVQGTTITTQYSPSGAIWRNTQLAAATNYIRVPRGNFNYTTAVTFEALFKLNSAPYQASPTGVPGIMSQWQYVGGADARGPRLAMIHQFGNLGRLQFSVPVGASTTRIITQATPYLEPGKTYHVVATFAPSSPTAATLFLYINGELNISGNPFTGTFVNDVNNFISLMSDYVDNSAANPSADIDLYLARVYNVAKNATEVLELYRNPWQLYQTPKPTFAISQQIKPLELATITSRRPYRQQPQAAIPVDMYQSGGTRLDFCLVPNNNRLIDLNRKVSSIASNGDGGFDELGSYVSTNTAAMQVPGYVGTAAGPLNNGWMPAVSSVGYGKIYTILYTFKVLSEDDGGEEPVNLTNDSTGLGWRVTSRMTYLQTANYYNRIRVQSSGPVLGAYVNGIVLDDVASTSNLKISTFNREVGKYYTVAATVTINQLTWPHAQHYHRIGSNSGEFVKIRTPLYAVWDGALPNAMLKSLSENPWHIFEQNKKYSYFAGEYPGAVTPPEPPLVLNSRFLLFFG